MQLSSEKPKYAIVSNDHTGRLCLALFFTKRGADETMHLLRLGNTHAVRMQVFTDGAKTGWVFEEVDQFTEE